MKTKYDDINYGSFITEAILLAHLGRPAPCSADFIDESWGIDDDTRIFPSESYDGFELLRRTDDDGSGTSGWEALEWADYVADTIGEDCHRYGTASTVPAIEHAGFDRAGFGALPLLIPLLPRYAADYLTTNAWRIATARA